MSKRLDVDELDKVAARADRVAMGIYFTYPGYELSVAWSPTIDGRDTGAHRTYADCYSAVDAEYIAASNPQVTRALIKRIRELESALQVSASNAMDFGDTGLAEELEDLLDKGVVIP